MALSLNTPKVYVVADALRRLEYNSLKNVKNINCHQRHYKHAKLVSRHMVNHGVKSTPLSSGADSNNSIIKILMNNVLTHTEKKDKTYSVTVTEIATNQHIDKTLQTFFSKEYMKGRITCRVINDVDILVYDNRYMCMSASLIYQVVQWYHYYLQHPSHTRLEETLQSVMYWYSIQTQIQSYTLKYVCCQKGKKTTRKYGNVPANYC